MGVESTNDVLNRLLVIHSRSLPVYLTYAPPWWKDQNGRIAEVLHDLARDQLELAEQSSRGEQRVLNESSHSVHLDAREEVVKAIRDMLELIR